MRANERADERMVQYSTRRLHSYSIHCGLIDGRHRGTVICICLSALWARLVLRGFLYSCSLVCRNRKKIPNCIEASAFPIFIIFFGHNSYRSSFEPFISTYETRSQKQEQNRKRGCTVIQDTLKIGQEYSTVPQAQERVSERASERVSTLERASG